MVSNENTLVEALLAVAAGEPDRALGLAASVAQAGSSEYGALAVALQAYLRSAASAGVYEDPTAFQAFIDGGRNPFLYDQAIRVVGTHQEQHKPKSVLDVGCGDGRISVASLSQAVTRLGLLEPSDMLDEARASLNDFVDESSQDIEVLAFSNTIQEYLSNAPTGERWDLVQSTFAMHSLDYAERTQVLGALAQRCSCIVLVEFDVPAFADASAEHAHYVVQRFVKGVAEYSDSPEVVSGFLLPVLVAQFAPERVRHTHEQPAETWAKQLREAGFRDVAVKHVANYWWADAVAIVGEV